MSGKQVAELTESFSQDNPSAFVTNLWTKFNDQRQGKIQEWLELRNYIFATDTSTTSNQSLPWKNSTTLPKLCQIRDNLHSNYISALFPNDGWMKWVGFSQDDAVKAKASAIESYMLTKTRESHFRTEQSKLLYDFIDYGNAFCTVDFEASYKELADGRRVPNYVGPRVRRISPLDIIFDPLASSFEESFKIVREVKTIGDIKKMASVNPEESFWTQALERREKLKKLAGGYSIEDFYKSVGYAVDGFGDLYEYYQSDYMEILTFYGDYHDQETGELHVGKRMVVVDRSCTVLQEDIPSWFGRAPIHHVGWRFRPDNLWAMGPLDNLVGMQYRIDHLENLKADAQDLTVHPPLKIIGEVEEFDWGPNTQIHIDESGDVQEMGQNLGGIITANNEIELLEARMEAYAGAPRQAMGIRTPGEKTAFEVQTLQNAAGRIFQEKITTYEIELLEPSLNDMLEVSRRLMSGSDIIRVMDNSIGFETFMTVTKEDITANGKLRPLGARHFAKQAQDLQNVVGLFSSPLGEMIAPHTSGKELSRFVEDILGLSGWDIFRPNVAVAERAETQGLMQQAGEDLEVAQGTPAEGSR